MNTLEKKVHGCTKDPNITFDIFFIAFRIKELTSLMRTEAFFAAWKNGVSQVYLKLLLFFSNEAL